MKFSNPANGHIEERNLTWLWTILFGGFYFLVSGLYIPLIIWMVIGVILFSSMGPPATILLLFVQIILAAFSGGMIRSAYLRKGWVEVVEGSMPVKAQMRKCPYCAEDILIEAIKCKHCGSDIPAFVIADPEEEDVLDRPPGMGINDWRENVMRRHKITQVGSTYRHNGVEYDSFDSLVAELKLRR